MENISIVQVQYKISILNIDNIVKTVDLRISDVFNKMKGQQQQVIGSPNDGLLLVTYEDKKYVIKRAKPNFAESLENDFQRENEGTIMF